MFIFELCLLIIVCTTTSAQDGSIGRRVPSFIASRGKKNEMDIEKEVPSLDYGTVDQLADHSDDVRYPISKRAHLGFQGTRGKKTSGLSYKRAMGFTASRGKKYDLSMYPKTDIIHYWLLRKKLSKRKFYGMRGKKIPYRGFTTMGVRGKKGPSSSTFFGTRGKKDDIPLFLIKKNSVGGRNSVKKLAAIMYRQSADKDYLNDNSNLKIPSGVAESTTFE